ncbi:unnamed protein product [Mycena citricolor]|uniref:Uncharacterized protein n=1 Tax=Mycena citricolor TaxID=2018698 RepID=A0AAD2GWQ3_9AGAR|nr:unnamed protein product [Mycena citricolor]
MDPQLAFYLNDWNAPIFSGTPDESVETWLATIRLGLKFRQAPQELWVRIALHFLSEDVQRVVRATQDMMQQLEPGLDVWEWGWFTRVLMVVHERVKQDNKQEPNGTNIGGAIQELRDNHPFLAGAAALGLVAVGGAVVVPAVLVGTLNILGFTATGVAAGSAAAWIQSVAYGAAVGSGSAFAWAQSAAMGGIVVATAPVQALTAGMMGLGAYIGWGRRREEQDHTE